LLSFTVCFALKAQQLGKQDIIPDGWRLIQTSEDEKSWMPPEKAAEFVAECGVKDQGFFDLTEFHEQWEQVEKQGIPNPSPLPSDCRYTATAVNPFLAQINASNWEDKVRQLSALPTRYYSNSNGERGAQIIYGWLQQICGSKCQPEYFRHSWLQPSVILRIRGTTTPNEVVVLGAHQDSTASPSTSNAPGADDDASGCAGVLEVARVLIENNYQPKKTIEFQFYAAEEVGLWGSQAIATKYAQDNVNIYAMIQFDMIGYAGSPPLFITDFVDTPLTTCLRTIASQIGTATWGSTRCGYACSDHASYNRAGYRASFPHESNPSNPRIHTTSDVLSLLSRNHAKYFVELGVAALIRLTS